jgi:hypothetical protein
MRETHDRVGVDDTALERGEDLLVEDQTELLLSRESTPVFCQYLGHTYLTYKINDICGKLTPVQCIVINTEQ